MWFLFCPFDSLKDVWLSISTQWKRNTVFISPSVIWWPGEDCDWEELFKCLAVLIMFHASRQVKVKGGPLKALPLMWRIEATPLIHYRLITWTISHPLMAFIFLLFNRRFTKGLPSRAVWFHHEQLAFRAVCQHLGAAAPLLSAAVIEITRRSSAGRPANGRPGLCQSVSHALFILSSCPYTSTPLKKCLKKENCLEPLLLLLKSPLCTDQLIN